MEELSFSVDDPETRTSKTVGHNGELGRNEKEKMEVSFTGGLNETRRTRRTSANA